MWASRNHEGLHLGIRHPDTPVAGEVLDEYTAAISAVLRQVAATGDHPLAPLWACGGSPSRPVDRPRTNVA